MIDTLYNEFITIFGEYEPVVGTDSTGVSFDCINFSYIGCILLVIVVTYGILRIIGNMFARL